MASRTDFEREALSEQVMASKNKKRSDRAKVAASDGLRQEVERLLAKDRLKDAVKQAKLCYKEEATPENHRLLERAYYLRADQLRKGAMLTSAQEVARHLLDFGITDAALVEGAAGLLMSLGMARDALKLQGRIDSPEARERLSRQAADQAVLHPERAAEVTPEVRQGSLRVREALQALDAGDDEKAMAALQDVSRASPFADWKLFVRGLSAHTKGKVEEARANWNRLDDGRAAARIARKLLALTGPSSDPESGGERPVAAVGLDAIETQVFREPVLGLLEQLRGLVAEGRWGDAVRRLSTLRFRLRNIDPRLAERLTRVLYFPIIRAATDLDYNEARALIGDFTRGVEPLPLDPRWNRLWAMIWESPQGDLDPAEDYWRAYLKDLETVPELAPEERTLARALVLNHIAGFSIDDAEQFAEESHGQRAVDPDLREARKRAVACLEESLKLAPAHRDTYQTLIDAYRAWEQPAQAAEAARRLVAQFPEDFEAWMFLADHHYRLEEGAEALEAVERARTLRPLDPTVASLEWGVHILRARQFALKGRWDEGRAEFATAERVSPDDKQSVTFLARKAVFELKAGQPDRAEPLIAEALERLAEPTPLWLTLLIEAIRYKLPGVDRDRFESRWVNALPRRSRSETAGEMADLLGAFLASGTEYPGRAGHVKQVADYLRRTTRIKYRLEDLVNVCAFLGLIPKERDLLDKLVKRGLKLFPKSPKMLILAGAREMEKGAFGARNLRLARQYFAQALEQARASSDADDAGLVAKIQESLSMIDDMFSVPMGMPFFGSGGMPPDLFEALGNMFGKGDFDPDYGFDDDDDDDDDEGWDAPPKPRPAPAPAPAARPAKGGRKRKK